MYYCIVDAALQWYFKYSMHLHLYQLFTSRTTGRYDSTYAGAGWYHLTFFAHSSSSLLCGLLCSHEIGQSCIQRQSDQVSCQGYYGPSLLIQSTTLWAPWSAFQSSLLVMDLTLCCIFIFKETQGFWYYLLMMLAFYINSTHLGLCALLFLKSNFSQEDQQMAAVAARMPLWHKLILRAA